MAVFKVVENTFRKPEIRNSVAENAANFVFSFENGNLVAFARKEYRDCQAGRSGADDRDPHPVGRSRSFDHFCAVGGRNIAFNRRKMNGGSFAAKHTVAFTLVFVVADQTADSGQRVVFKKHPSGFVQLAVKHQLDHGGDRCVDGTALLTLGNFTVQTTVRFI